MKSSRSHGLAARFAALAGLAVTVILAVSGYVGARLEASALREQLERQGGQLTELAAAEVANDMFTFALSDLDAKILSFRKDPSVRFLEIKDANGKAIKAAGDPQGRLVLHTRDIVAGGGKIGTISLGLSTESIDRAVALSWWLLLAREVVVLLVLWIALYVLVRRMVARPLEEIAQVASGVANGDLKRRFAVRGHDEIGRSGDAFNAVMQRFHDIVSQVRESAVAVSTGASEISRGNADLSKRTEEQATSLEETAATLEQFASTTKQNAESAAKANEVAQSAGQIASRGNAAVEGVVATMSEISANSKKIVDIITMIDGIAFQTNILALNAAVEAARAGDHGRGFAVVASEVRALAQRSGDAAKEIKTLIASSAQKVDVGAKVAHQAGDTISELVSHVENVRMMMASIARASREQSTGVQQINDTVAQMESIVQQNATVVEQAANSAAALEAQAGGLVAIVAGFHIMDATARAVPRSRSVDARAVLERAAREAPAKASLPAPACDRHKAPGHSEQWQEF